MRREGAEQEATTGKPRRLEGTKTPVTCWEVAVQQLDVLTNTDGDSHGAMWHGTIQFQYISLCIMCNLAQRRAADPHTHARELLFGTSSGSGYLKLASAKKELQLGAAPSTGALKHTYMPHVCPSVAGLVSTPVQHASEVIPVRCPWMLLTPNIAQYGYMDCL